MSYYGYKITESGQRFLARLLDGQTMEISRVVVGSGKVLDGEKIEKRTDLVSTVALATSLEPVVEDNKFSITVEYRSDLNGGLEEGFELNEFGIFVIDEEAENGETLLLYATLGDHPQYVSAYTGAYVDVRRFPVTIVIGEDRNVIVGYTTEGWMTQDDVKKYYKLVLLPLIKEEIDEKIKEHDANPLSHQDIRALIDSLNSKVRNLEIAIKSDVKDNLFSYTFENLDKINMTEGIWNEENARIEF